LANIGFGKAAIVVMGRHKRRREPLPPPAGRAKQGSRRIVLAFGKPTMAFEESRDSSSQGHGDEANQDRLNVTCFNGFLASSGQDCSIMFRLVLSDHICY